jgi:uncharacterized protein
VPGRDRDTAGRARNARPRDALGRPLPRGAAGQAPGPDEPALPPAEALASAQRLLDADRPFHAHEVLEAAWKAAPAADRDLWQGLAQLAVGLTHVRRGNTAGALTLLERGTARLAGYPSPAPHDVDTGGLQQSVTSITERLRAGQDASASAPPPGWLRLVLRRPAAGGQRPAAGGQRPAAGARRAPADRPPENPTTPGR